MNWILLAFFIGIAIGILIGRYIFFKRVKSGMITTVVPQKTITAKDFKPGEIYKAMASSLKRKTFVVVSTDNPEKTKDKIAKAARMVPGALKHELVPGTKNNYKISIV